MDKIGIAEALASVARIGELNDENLQAALSLQADIAVLAARACRLEAVADAARAFLKDIAFAQANDLREALNKLDGK